MSTNAESEVRDIGKSKQEALRALLNSLAPHEKVAIPNNSDVDKLAERLDELLASKGGLLGAQTNIPRDDQGRPLNEEGLPIMEIVELVTNDSSANLPPSSRIASPSSVSGQAPLSPLPNWALSPVALAARRRERDRILDLLEQEEQEELARDVSGGTTVTRMETVSPVEPKTPPRTLGQVMRPSSTASRMTHPEQHVGSANTAVAATIPHPQKEMIGGDAARKPKKQKSVSFKDLPPPEHSSRQIHTATSSVDWGDVVPVSLDPRSLRTPGPKVMKELVVERPLLRSNPKIDRTADSDDEDEYVEEAECVSEEGSEPEVPPEALYPAASDDESEDDEENDTMTNNDETDIDEAMLQREIALAYHARRNQIGPDVASGPLFDSTQIHGISGHRGENAAKSILDDQFNTTRFRGSRLDGDPQTLVNSAIQFGRLVDGQLVAGEVADQEIDASINALTGANDTNEEEDMTEKMIQLLMQGEIFPRDEFSIPPAAPSGLPQTPASPGSSRIGPFQPQTAPKPKPKIKQPISDTLSTRNQRPVHQPAAAVTSTAQPFPPMVIESGFGFDPAFQVAPNPGASATKPVAPMSERVKERSVLMSSSAQGKSRLARALETEAANSPSTASINQETPSALRGDIVERVKPIPGKSQPPETSRRISRFRAERAGIL